jgi:hypothetical protein
MPYKSKAQQGYFNAHKDQLEKQGVDVDEWNKASKGKKIPKRVKQVHNQLRTGSHAVIVNVINGGPGSGPHKGEVFAGLADDLDAAKDKANRQGKSLKQVLDEKHADVTLAADDQNQYALRRSFALRKLANV